MADAEKGRLRAAIVLDRELMAGLDADEHVGLAADLADTMADLALSSGDEESAREIYTCFLVRFGSVPGAAEKVEGEFARIALLGTPVPAIEARDLDGGTIALSPGRGAYRLIIFWATFSKPSPAELSRLAEASAPYRDRGLEVIGVALDGSGAEVAAIANRLALPWRQVHNATSGADWVGPFRVTGVPSTVLVGPDGTIVRLGLNGSTVGPTLAGLLGGPSAE